MSDKITGTDTRAKDMIVAVSEGQNESLQDAVASVTRRGGHVNYPQLGEDLYFIEMGDERVVRDWARELAIGEFNTK